MSHVTVASGRIQQNELDMQALKLACDELNLEFCENVTTFKWYGQWVKDYHADDAAYRVVDPTTFGKCKHVLRVKGAPASHYEVGLVEMPDGSLAPVFDHWGVGQLLQKVVGPACKKLMATINRYKVIAKTAHVAGGQVKEIVRNGSKTRVVITMKPKAVLGAGLGGKLT